MINWLEIRSNILFKTARLLFLGAILLAILYFLLGGHEKLAQLIANSAYPSWLWLITCCIIYAMVLIIPFAPGMEIGVLIMAMFATPGIIAAWITTVIALTLAFIIGRAGQHLLWIQRLLFLAHQQHSLPLSVTWVRSKLAQYPYLTIAILLNLPGNTFIGGGGGISIVSGALGSVSLKGFATTVALSSSIVPIILMSGLLTLGQL